MRLPFPLRRAVIPPSRTGWTAFLLLVLLPSLLSLFPLSASGEGRTLLSERTYRLGQGAEAVAGEDRSGPYTLARRPLFAGSERIELHGEVLKANEDYWIRYDRGEITFAFDLPAGDSATVRYRFLPLPIPEERFLHRLRLVEGEEEGILVPAKSPAPLAGPLDTGALRVGGSKSFSVLIGSDRELTLEQALRVRVTGHLTEGVRVTAQLTDQNLPFQPEGRSERLEELDQVLVKVEGDRFGATLGDYEIRYDDSEFGRYQRVLQGASGMVRGEGYEAEVSGGLSKGEYRSVEIRGVEGKQGPYRLQGPSSLGELVVAGSEQVWLDGRRMSRGDDNDYVIDYSEGSVTFNPNVRISSDSRVAVDFQVTGDRYRRNFFTSRFRLRGGEGRYRLGGTFLSERDDEGEPEAIVLTEPEYDSLRAAGDSSPLGSSARPVEEGGDYDTLGGVFVFAGRDSGDFAVSFRQVEPGAGDYADSISSVWGRRIFVFVGEGRGSYTPAVPIPLPESHRVFSLAGEANPGGPLRVGGEVAWSDRDRNVLSSLDDGDNTGTGAKLEARLDEVPLHAGGVSLGGVELLGAYRRMTENFEPLGRYREPHRDDRWMTADLRRAVGPGRQEEDRLGAGDAFAPRGEETIVSGEGAWRRGTALGRITLGSEGGTLRRRGFDSDRWSWRGDLEQEGRYRAGYKEERIESADGDTIRGETSRRTGEGSLRVGPVRPSLRVVRSERAFDREGVLFRGDRGAREKIGLGFGSGPRFDVEGAVTFERNEYADTASASGWSDWYDGRTDEVSLRWRGALTVAAAYSHRALDYGETVTEGNRRSDLGRLEVQHGGIGGALRGTWSYEVTTEERRPRRRLLLRAPAGEKADYDSLGNYFPGEGTFNQEIVDGDPEPVVEIEVGATIRVEPGRRKGASPSRLWKGIRTETFARVEERSRTDDPASLLLLDPDAFQRNGTTIRGNTVLRQEVRWSDPLSEGSVNLRYQREDREENEFALIHRDDLVHTFLVRGKAPLGERWSGELEWNRRLEREDSNDSRAVDLAGDDWKASLVYLPGPRWRLIFPGAYQIEKETVRREKVASWRVEPEASVNLAARSRLDGRVSFVQFLKEDLDRAGSFLRNRREGLRWRLQFAYEWNRVLSSSLAYSGENLKGEETKQQFRAEMRAFF
ncbi:MAG: hypothetical protein ABIK65_03525 [Candidatus Eisenbacteria bacterium]